MFHGCNLCENVLQAIQHAGHGLQAKRSQCQRLGWLERCRLPWARQKRQCGRKIVWVRLFPVCEHVAVPIGALQVVQPRQRLCVLGLQNALESSVILM